MAGSAGSSSCSLPSQKLYASGSTAQTMAVRCHRATVSSSVLVPPATMCEYGPHPFGAACGLHTAPSAMRCHFPVEYRTVPSTRIVQCRRASAPLPGAGEVQQFSRPAAYSYSTLQPGICPRGILHTSGENHSARSGKVVAFGNRYSRYIDCPIESLGKRVSLVEKEKQQRKEQQWRTEQQMLCYRMPEQAHDEPTDVFDIPCGARGRSRSEVWDGE